MLPIFLSRPLQPVCFALAMSVVFLAVCDVEAATVVVPAQFENVDANAFCCSGPAPRPGARLQEVHLASEFAHMTLGAGMLTQLAYRPDKDVTAPRTLVWHDLELRLSTTDRGPGSMSSRFDNNFGTDTTVVYSGDLTMSTQAAGPRSGPRPFDYVIEFQQPFLYDPSDGNLIIDWRVSSIQGGPRIDGPRYYDGQDRTLPALSPSATNAVVMFDAHNVVEFTVVPETLRGDLNVDGEVNGLDVDAFVAVLLSGPYQAEADMNLDAVVNGLDVDPFVAAVVGGGVAAVPEPSTLLLTFAALGILGAWRRKR